ncbi:amino acid permease 6-like isoform X1 [Dioscorea cayenensis subsp. rotundata]|uniref:Amino acid permease 6-like isoform X1 n=1 Tax=Dioscorea cayennensis subsp. rotundata TaxID=55577 RepID=A0AB40C1Y0_DIOCR|nr:amino acid permease 6-like isoform X1 [Dioscorea cayenensis subsp. rotundata]
MQIELPNMNSFIEESLGRAQDQKNSETDDQIERTGTLLTATSHIITSVIGSGVLSLAWAIAQLGWIAGPATLLAFAFITWFCSALLADCYRSPDPINGKRNHTYMDAVKANLGGVKVQLCGLAQYVMLIGVTIAYIITSGISMVAVKRSNCFHKNGIHAECYVSPSFYILIFACIQIVLSQIPNFHKIWGLSIIAAVMSFAYSLTALGLSIAMVAEKGLGRSSLTGATIGVDVSASDKVWRVFQSFGNIACAFTYSMVLIEIQDTLKSSPPENKVMKKASLIGVTITTMFYMLCGVFGYAAFGNNAPGNMLTGFGFYNPFWLVDLANICIVIHLIGAYQVFSQPIFQFVESSTHRKWPENYFLNYEHLITIPMIGQYRLSFFRLACRTLYIAATTFIAMIFPFFNDFIGLVGGIAFWPLTVYFPVEMYIKQAKILRFSGPWFWLHLMSSICFVASVLAAGASIQGLSHDFGNYHPFKNI